MIAFGMYLMKVSGCLALFYGIYLTLFRNLTFFGVNRFYLLLGLAGSFAIPLLNLPLATTLFDRAASYALLETLNESLDLHSAANPVNALTATNDFSLLSTIYLSGVTLMVLRITYFIIRMIRVWRLSEPFISGDWKLFRTKSGQPFSFFNRIYVPENTLDLSIIEHEKAHVRQFHWIDLLLMEIIYVLLWFNPVIFFYKRSIKMQHEYLADASTLSAGVPREDYLGCMLNQLYIDNGMDPVSPFYSKSVKQRIIMITRSKSSGQLYLRYLFVVPAVSLLLQGFSFTPPGTSTARVFSQIRVKDENKPSGMPVESEKVKEGASGYGMRRNPYTRKMRFHTGIDFSMPEGEPVRSTASGVVLKSVNDPQWGNLIVVKHSDVYATSYSHLKNSIVRDGDLIKKGETIGFVGSSGWSVGSHLHYEVLKQGKAVDPSGYLPIQH
jgi:hypothetical protein